MEQSCVVGGHGSLKSFHQNYEIIINFSNVCASKFHGLWNRTVSSATDMVMIWAAARQNEQNDVRPAKTQISLGIH